MTVVLDILNIYDKTNKICYLLLPLVSKLYSFHDAFYVSKYKNVNAENYRV